MGGIAVSSFSQITFEVRGKLNSIKNGTHPEAAELFGLSKSGVARSVGACFRSLDTRSSTTITKITKGLINVDQGYTISQILSLQGVN